MSALLRWSAVAAAVGGLCMAGLTASLGPASECSTRPEVHWWIATPFFALFVIAGAYVVAAGTRVERLVLFLFAALTMAGYIWGLAMAVPEVVQFGINCPAA
jgi:hypothetical protein